MYRFHYFIRFAPSPIECVPPLYAYKFLYRCVRIPEGDPQIIVFEKIYAQKGWNMVVQYDYLPTQEEEISQLRKEFQAFKNCEIIIETPKLK